MPSRISEILEQYDRHHMTLIPSLKKGKREAEAAINAYVAEVIGKDESETYTSNLKATWHDQKVADGTIARRNQLRAEMRRKAGL